MPVSEAAKRLGVTPQRVHAMRSLPDFPRMERLWGDYVIRREELERFARSYVKKPGGRKRIPA